MALAGEKFFAPTSSNIRQPAALVFRTTFHNGKKGVLQLLCDLAPRTTANFDVVNSRDRRDLCRAARKEHLVGYVQGLAWNRSRGHGIAQFSGQCNHRMSRNTRQNRRLGRRRVNLPILRHKNILAAAFAHITLCVQAMPSA